MKLKPIFTFSRGIETKIRLFRAIWERGTVGDGSGYSACLSLALVPKLFRLNRKYDFINPHDIRVVVLGVSIHYMRSYSGRFV